MLCANYDAWVVGSAANPAIEDPRDYDVIVPPSRWPMIAGLVPRDATPNTFGGFKFTSDGCEIDMWCGDMAWMMNQQPRTEWVWNPHLGIRFHRIAS